MKAAENMICGFRIVRLGDVDSTNRWLMEHGEGDMVAVADYQSAGRGQGNHTWESAPGQNLLFSVLVHPVSVPPSRQFLLSEAWALALCGALSEYTDGIAIKWPNDIYWHDRKLSGTLIETRLSGGVLRDVVVGTGINVNQTRFLSDAPNPVSLRQACGTDEDIDREELLGKVLSRFSDYLRQLLSDDDSTIQHRYHQLLFRRTGFYPYEDASGCFEAETESVAPSGTLTLRTRDGTLRHYEQREVRFVLE